jgi:formylglycine-generating enzyme required for sulfatase activity
MFRILAAALLLMLSASSPASADTKRVALVLGIGDYQHLSSLTNPVPDAKAIATELRDHGFQVSEHYNLDRADLLDALEAFKRQAQDAEVALVYYAGHGMEIDGRNVVAPTDMEIECENKTTLRSVELDQIFAAAGPAPQQIVLLDACRNNPFPQCPTRSLSSGGGFRGFSRQTEEDRSLLVANATLSGQLAADGAAGEHSPFAKSLLKNFEENPRLFMRDVLEMTAKDVRVASRGAQIPEITTRGGSPRVCLDATGCGVTPAALPSEGVLKEAGASDEARAILEQLGFMDKSRGEDSTLEDAIKRFQAKAGMTPDGQITASLLAVLRATKAQIAAFPVTPKPGAAVPGIGTGPLEHEVGSTFKDCESCPEMVVTPAGRFRMGAPKGEKGRQPAEEPQHDVTVGTPLAVGKFEVTFDEWEACTLEGGCANYRPQDSGWGRGRRPAIYVSYDDAKAYVEWLRQKSGKAYRLLSESEWEFAARGGTSTPFAGGDSLAPTQANFDASMAAGKKQGSYEGKSVEVGTFPPNPYGLHDMEGNVFEWVEDCWNKTHAGAPSDASPRGGDCKRRVAKGGAWYYEAEFARPSARMSFPKGSRLNVIGFRVARPLE